MRARARRGILVLASLALALLAAVVTRAKGEPLEGDGVRVLVGSALEADGTLRSGSPARRGESPLADHAFDVAADLVRRGASRPVASVVVHAAPALAPGVVLHGATTHEASAELLVHDDAVAATVVAHELAHVSVLARRRGPRPSSASARRVLAALDEGVADYAAFVVTGEVTLGDPSLGPTRDLDHPPAPSSATWAEHLVPAGLDRRHELGWRLASGLRRARGRSTDVRDDVLAAAAPAGGESMIAVLASFVDAVPTRSRDVVRSAVREWVPAEVPIK